MRHLALQASDQACPIHLVNESGWPDFMQNLAPFSQNFVNASGFLPKSGRLLALPGPDGSLSALLFGTGADADLSENPFLLGKLATDLPPGDYAIISPLARPDLALLGFLLGGYRFEAYKANPAPAIRLLVPDGVDGTRISILAEAIAFGRDLINRPANDLTPEALSEAARGVAEQGGAVCEIIFGEDLLARNFPLIHAVGRASAFAPRLVDFSWGDPAHPRVTLVGKGVTFDTGGLNLKPDASMLLMKKDMGGAATTLAIARMIMALQLKIRLRVLLPIVENSVASTAFRPGDVYRSRKGLSVEIGNTDAEGRLILCDALAYADEESPDLLLDFATLTGAARVALGPELPPFFTKDERLAAAISAAGLEMHDPVWRLPLWPGYESMLDSKIANLNNVSSGGFAGSITAALYLNRFVSKTKAYAHFDVYGWNPSSKPGRPEGGEVQAARLALALIERFFAADFVPS
jgi:leucyl aminopeptidase